MKEHAFVGRQAELAQLDRFLERALAGNGQICFVEGGAGSGKSFLVHHFVAQAEKDHPELVAAVGTGNAQTGIADPYLPFREALVMLTDEATAQRGGGRLSDENSNRLRAITVRSAQVLVEVAPELLGTLVPGGKLVGAFGRAIARKAGWMDEMDALVKQQARAGAGVDQKRIVEQYTTFLQRLSSEMPLILFLDDLQWADNASLALLFHLARHVGEHKILIVGAYRPNDVALGRDGGRHPLVPVVHELKRYRGDITIDLDAIPREAGRHFVDALLDRECNTLGESFRQALFRQTGGHALFAVELIQAMKERGTLVRDGNGCWTEGASLDWLALPARVEGVIEERIARLNEELSEMLTIASVEGEQFLAEVIADVLGMRPREAVRLLSGMLGQQHRLVGAQGMLELGGEQFSLYRFLHILFQQYLYGRLAEAERAYLHRDVGAVLEKLSGGDTEEIAGQLARHFEQAGVPDKAARYLLQAATRAHRLSAHREAIGHLSQAISLCASLPADGARTRLELELHTLLAAVLVVAEGYASPNVGSAYDRARELSRALGNPPQAMPVLYGTSAYHFVRADLRHAYGEAEELLALASQADNAGYRLGAGLVLGAAAMHMGDFDRARSHLGDVVETYDLAQHGELAYSLGHDPSVAAYCYLSFVEWHQGYPDRADEAMRQALGRAEVLNHPYTRGYAASFAAMLLQMKQEVDRCAAQAKDALRIGQEGGFPLWSALGALTHGWARVRQGSVKEGLDEVVQGLAAWERSGAALALPYQRSVMADACLAAGDQEKGLAALEQASSNPEERWWLAEQDRLRGDLLLLGPGREAEAKECLRQAVERAAVQDARSLELRAAAHLARLLEKDGHVEEAVELLAPRVAWFRVDLDTHDLREARQLLGRLQGVY